MFVAMNADQQLVTLRDHEQADRLRQVRFVCPACRQPVRLRNGAVMPAHFAHVGKACAASSEAESTVHLTGKRWLAQLGERLGYQVALETYYPAIKQRADVVWVKSKRTVVIEFQCSPLNPQRLLARTQGYHQLGLDCIWVLGPRYHSCYPGAMQARFLQLDAVHGLHLWYCDGRSWLACWQWQETHYQVVRYTLSGQSQRRVGLARSASHFIRQLENRLHYREPKTMALAALAYQKGHYLAGVPWVVSAALTHLPGLRLPEWQLRVRWLLVFGEAAFTREQSAAFFQAQALPALTPLVANDRLLARIERQWLATLQAGGWLIATETGWDWRARPPWYPDLTHKLAASKH